MHLCCNNIIILVDAEVKNSNIGLGLIKLLLLTDSNLNQCANNPCKRL